MRSPLITLIIAGALAASPAPSGADATSPAPPLCADPCSIAALGFGYLPPVTSIADGTTVTWTTTDSSHPTTNSAVEEESCFLVPVGASAVPVPVRFDLADGGVIATEAPGTPEALSSRCGNAVATIDGAFVLPFRCLLHGPMHGALLIERSV